MQATGSILNLQLRHSEGGGFNMRFCLLELGDLVVGSQQLLLTWLGTSSHKAFRGLEGVSAAQACCLHEVVLVRDLLKAILESLNLSLRSMGTKI